MKKTVKSTESMTPQATTLYRNAEKIARKKADRSPKKQESILPEEAIRILHELQVHQIELEMQNEELRRTQAELDSSRARYFDLYDLAPVGYVTVSEQGLILEANLTAATLLGVSRGTLVKLLLTRFILKEDQDIYYLHCKQLLDTSEPQMCELRMVKKDETAFWAHLAATVAKDEGGVTVYRVVMNDITEHKQAEEALHESEKRYRTILENIQEGYFEIDLAGNFTFFNDSMCRIFGYSKEKLMGMNNRQYTDEETAKKVFQEFNKVYNTREPIEGVDWQIIGKDGDKRDIEASVSLLQDSSGKPTGFRGILRDVTNRKKADSQREAMLEALRDSEKRYLELSIIDDLTQLYNSRHFYAQLENEIERSNRYEQPLTLLLMDLDKFKAFNDAYGHVEGDYVLSRLGQVIKRCLRETDSAYRYGGEEFTIMLPMTTSEEGIVTAKRIQTELRKEAFSPVLGQEVYLTISIGLAQYKPKEEMKAFVHRVDQLMYKGKKNGKGRICSDDGDIQ
jgi:diguanylate cyclase (GGDEF)-like protein/PAS domain S-box-containing protein